MSDHARLAPSAAHRWIRCPGSVRLSQGAAAATSEYAALGTAAHKLLEHVLLLGMDPDEWLGHTIVVPVTDVRGHWGEMRFEVDTDMTTAVGLAADYIHGYEARNPCARVQLERRVNPGRLFDREDCWGTLDVSIHNTPELVIIDYKHGAGVYVDVENNEQLLTYAVGCLAELTVDAYETVRLVIIQPRHPGASGPIRDHVVPVKTVRDFARTLADAAARTDEPEPALQAGDHCMFCKAAPQCPELAAHAKRLAQEEFNEEDLRRIPLGSEQFGDLLRQVPIIESWCSAISAAAQHYLESGGRIPGFKLVAGRKARFWRDEEHAKRSLLYAGFREDDVAPRSLVSVAQAEKLFRQQRRGKEFRTEYPPLIGETRGAPTIAPATDPRPALNHVGEQFDNLDGEEILS